MSTFVKEACKFVQAMFEPILVDGLSGKVSAEVLDGYIDIWVPVSQRDQRRLEPNYWAFNTLIQTLAQVLASELPDGVTSDAIAIRLLPPGTRSRSKLQKARQTQHSHHLPAEILGMTVEELLRRLGTRYERSDAKFSIIVINENLLHPTYINDYRELCLTGTFDDENQEIPHKEQIVIIEWHSSMLPTQAEVIDKRSRNNGLWLQLRQSDGRRFDKNKLPYRIRSTDSTSLTP